MLKIATIYLILIIIDIFIKIKTILLNIILMKVKIALIKIKFAEILLFNNVIIHDFFYSSAIIKLVKIIIIYFKL